MAANSNRGEVSFEVGGVEYIFKFGVNAQAIIEDRTNMNIGKFLAKIEQGFGARDIRLIFYASLAEHHPNLTELEVGALIDEIGGTKASEIFLEAAKIAKAKTKVNGADEKSRPMISAKERIGTNS